MYIAVRNNEGNSDVRYFDTEEKFKEHVLRQTDMTKLRFFKADELNVTKSVNFISKTIDRSDYNWDVADR